MPALDNWRSKKDRFLLRVRRFLHPLIEAILFTVSLPERTLRSLAALSGGVTTLVTDTLFPRALRQSTTYQVTIGLLQRFVIERVAGIEAEIEEDGKNKLADDYLQRKVAGTALEAAGLFTMGASPLWVAAIAGDAAGGSKIFLKRLVAHLKARGVMAEESEATELLDVLEAVQSASSQTATAIDAPPLSRDQLAEIATEMKQHYGDAFRKTANLIPTLEEIWSGMEQLASRENMTLSRLGGIMTVDALNMGRKGAHSALAIGQTGVEMFDENILNCYRETLADMNEEGVDKYVGNHLRPFLDSAKEHFDAGKRTWTERRLMRQRD